MKHWFNLPLPVKKNEQNEEIMPIIRISVCVGLCHGLCWTDYFSSNLMNVWVTVLMSTCVSALMNLLFKFLQFKFVKSVVWVSCMVSCQRWWSKWTELCRITGITQSIDWAWAKNYIISILINSFVWAPHQINCHQRTNAHIALHIFSQSIFYLSIAFNASLWLLRTMWKTAWKIVIEFETETQNFNDQSKIHYNYS